jgi:AraC family ethanolamine operon transcriptional activator
VGSRHVSGQLILSDFGGLTLTHGKFSCDIHVSGTYSNEKLSIGVLLKAHDVRCFGKDARAGDMVVAGKARENDGRYRSELEYAIINVDKSDILGIAEAHGYMICPGWLDGSDLHRLEDRKAVRLVQSTKALLGKLPNESLLAIGTEAEHSVAEEIVRLFASGLSGVTTNERMGEEPHGCLPKLVRQAEGWLEAEPHRVPRIQELSRNLNVSPRQLYRSFHAEVGISPAKYLQRYRLTRARFELLAADPAETTVTSVALFWGFWELGRFAVEFRKLFGESPSKTLTSVR